MKLHDKREANYAYNINGTNNSFGSKKVIFSMIGTNFYDEIITSDVKIKNNKKTLGKIKNSSIKESVYCNKNIPKSWKTILGYTEEVYNAIDKDPNFAYYIGRSNKEEITNDFLDTKLKTVENIRKNTMSLSRKNSNLNQKDELINSLKDFNDSKEKEKEEKDNLLQTEKDIVICSEKPESVTEFDLSANKHQKNKMAATMPHFWGGGGDMLMNDKLISSKLDEYRGKFDLNKFMNELKANRRKEGKDKELINYIPDFIKERENNYREFIKSNAQNNKQTVLRSSIYNNLLPKEEKKYMSLPKISKKKKFEPAKTETIFLHQNTEFDTPIEITNPKIKRDLELINNYGPRYTHCFCCNRRNLEFYQKAEPKQTLVLLKYLKKIKLGDKEDEEKK